ncbi:MAG: sigma factor-like helix-turn-helix DNA-binding protein [Christensenella sp.]
MHRTFTHRQIGGNQMKQINLKKYYPSLYLNDTFLMVSDTVASALAEEVRKENAQRAKILYHGAYYSLDKESFIETKVFFAEPLIEETFEQQQLTTALYAAIIALPDKQAKRIYARYVLGLRVTDIAKMEGVSKMSVSESIVRALKKIKNTLTKV